MRKEDIVARLEELTARKRAIDEEARTRVREFLEDRGPDGVSFTDNPAYALVEGCDCWFEDHVYGVRLRDGTLEVSLETACGEGGQDVPDWGEDSRRTEYDHYSSINWLSILDSLAYLEEDGR